MYKIVFYEDKAGNSSVAEYLYMLDSKAQADKDSRVRLGKILRYISLLEMYGTRAGLPTSRHIEDDIWELRPLNERFFYAYWKDDTFVILHHYVKKSEKAPRKEIEQAKRNLKDYLERNT